MNSEEMRQLMQTQGIDVPEQIDIEDVSVWDALSTGAKTGALRTTQGIEQLYQQLSEGEESDLLKLRAAEREGEYARVKEGRPYTAGVGNLAGAVASTLPAMLIPGVGTGATLGSKILPWAMRGASQGAAAAGAQYVPEGGDRLTNTLIGAGTGAIADPLLGVGVSAFQNRANWPQLFGAGYAGEELAARGAAAAGTEAPLGGVIGSPLLSKFETNTLPNIPGAGMNESTARAAQNLKREGTGLFEGMTGGRSPREANVTPDIEQRLIEQMTSVRTQGSQKFKDVDAIATQLGVDTSYDNFAKTAKDILRKEKGVDPVRGGDIPKDYLNRLQEAIDLSEAGQRAAYKDAHLRRSDLLEKGRQADRRGNTQEAKAYRELADATLKDMEEAALNFGDPRLSDMYLDARSYYRENVVPLSEDRTLKKYIKDDDLSLSDRIVPDFVKPGSKLDQVNQMKKLTDRLDPQGLDELRFEYFKDSFNKDDILDPKRFRKNWDSLGPRQKQAMFADNPDVISQIDDYIKRVDINPAALDRMLNPPTGQRLLPWTVGGTIAGTGGAIGGIPGALGALGGVGMAGRGATKFLTSEAQRNKIIDRLVNPIIPQDTAASRLPQRMTPALSAQTAEQEMPKGTKTSKELTAKEMREMIEKNRGAR